MVCKTSLHLKFKPQHAQPGNIGYLRLYAGPQHNFFIIAQRYLHHTANSSPAENFTYYRKHQIALQGSISAKACLQPVQRQYPNDRKFVRKPALAQPVIERALVLFSGYGLHVTCYSSKTVYKQKTPKQATFIANGFRWERSSTCLNMHNGLKVLVKLERWALNKPY